MPELDNRPTAHYRGDVTTDTGRVVGPNSHGEHLVMEDARYDPATDTTTARFRVARAGDLTPATMPVGGVQ